MLRAFCAWRWMLWCWCGCNGECWTHGCGVACETQKSDEVCNIELVWFESYANKTTYSWEGEMCFFSL